MLKKNQIKTTGENQKVINKAVENPGEDNFLLSGAYVSAQSDKELEMNFRNPPQHARPQTWCTG